MKAPMHGRNHWGRRWGLRLGHQGGHQGGLLGWLAAGVAAAGALGGLAYAGRERREEQYRWPRWARKLAAYIGRRTPAKRLHL